jgi:hypothetical protein
LNETKDTVANWRDSGASPPAAPSNLVATAASQTQIDLDWTDNASNEDGFRIERSPDGSSNWTQIATVGANVSAFSDTGLQASTWYYYQVRAYDEVGNSGYSNVAGARTEDPPLPPLAPSNLAATAVSQTEVDLTWIDNADNENGFEIERSLDKASWSVIATVGSNVTSYSDSGLQHSTTYYYQVRAYNGAGYSDYSNMAEATTHSPPPYVDQTADGESAVAGAVSGSYVDTQANGDGAWQTITERESGGRPSKRYTYLEHKWTFNVQPGSGVTFFANAWAPASSDGDSFVLAYSTDDASYTDMFTVTATYDDDSYQTFALPPSTSGTVFVRVMDTDQTPGHREKDSVSVDHLFMRTELLPGEPPAAPTNLSATTVSASQVDLSWTDNADNELGFLIERSLDGSSWAEIDSVGADTSSYSDGGLQPSTTYHYRVRAYNGSGNSGYSNTASATTEQASSIHVGDLEALSEWVKASRWNAEVTITVHDANEALVIGARVIGVWGDGASGGGECTTDGSGSCKVSKSNIKSNVGSVSFTITGVELAPYLYNPSNNHDPDGDSNGTVIVSYQPL